MKLLGGQVEEEGWPWCEPCQSYHHPKNPTCRKPFARWRAALNLEWDRWLLLAVALWVLADVAPGYHRENAQAAHDLYTYAGGVAFVAALRKLAVDIRR